LYRLEVEILKFLAENENLESKIGYINKNMPATYYLDRMQESKEFRFDKLILESIDNEPVKKYYKSDMTDVEYCLFHFEVSNGEEYFEILHNYIKKSLKTKTSAPVVRFADGEYAFYAESLQCNGLYQQAESVKAIRNAIPAHIQALKILDRVGKFSPVIFPGNVQPKKKTLFSFFRKKKGDDSAIEFIEFLYKNNIKLTRDNYIPFFIVYAYLTSERFSKLIDGKKLCIVSSECNMESFRQWFNRFYSRPNIIFVQIPESYVATQWQKTKGDILADVPSDADICLVGAGIGSLLVCIDIANKFSIPAIDAGHVLNMMNSREDKSDGPRLYTLHR